MDKAYGYNVQEGGMAPSMPEEFRIRMSERMKGNQICLNRPCSEETKRKISAAQKGRPFTQEHKDRISAAKRGRSHPSPSPETKKKISDSHKKNSVYCPETDTIYPSIQECGRQLNIGATAICAVCKGKHKTAHGYHFYYYDDAINA